MNIEQLGPHLIITTNEHLLAVDLNTGDNQTVRIAPPQLPSNLTRGQLEVLNKQDRTINTITISQDEKFIGVSTENKQVLIYDNNLNLLKNFLVSRTASKLAFSKSGEVLVADRTGDVFLYKLDGEDTEPILLLGHLSMILDFVFSECGKYIVTCDRDEKIRVSHFPNTYNIVSYCLGHEEFVTVVKLVGAVLVSASGDGTVRFWNYLQGEQVGLLNTNEHIRNAKLMEEFSQEMDKEKVDVTALPISDMKIRTSNDGNLTIAVSLFRNKSIQLYKTNLNTFKSNYFKSVDLEESPHKFYLSDKLYIFTNSRIIVYNNDYREHSPCLENFHKQHKNALKMIDNNSLIVLYKRKFDNVQEYLERKKARLGIK